MVVFVREQMHLNARVLHQHPIHRTSAPRMSNRYSTGLGMVAARHLRPGMDIPMQLGKLFEHLALQGHALGVGGCGRSSSRGGRSRKQPCRCILHKVVVQRRRFVLHKRRRRHHQDLHSSVSVTHRAPPYTHIHTQTDVR
jgi:hypothetical protein